MSGLKSVVHHLSSPAAVKTFHISCTATLKNTLNRTHWLPISQSSPSVDTCTHNWLSWFSFFVLIIFDSFTTRGSNVAAICSSFPPPRLEVFISSSLPLSFAAPPQSGFSLFSSFISSTQMAPFIFRLRSPMLLCLRLLSGLLVLVKAKLKMIAVRLLGFFFFFFSFFPALLH